MSSKRRQRPGGDEDLGARLRAARQAADLTQYELGELAEVGQPLISQIERGKKVAITHQTYFRIEAALGLPPGALLHEIPHPPTSASLERFLASATAAELGLSPNEVDELRRLRWYDYDEEVPDLAWVDFVRARRSVRRATEHARSTPESEEAKPTDRNPSHRRH